MKVANVSPYPDTKNITEIVQAFLDIFSDEGNSYLGCKDDDFYLRPKFQREEKAISGHRSTAINSIQ